MEQKEEVMSIENIQNKVYVLRGQQVMLDYDLAEIYGYEVKRLNEQVKRNIARVFYRASYIESWGRGIQKIRDACKNLGREEPEYIVPVGA